MPGRRTTRTWHRPTAPAPAPRTSRCPAAPTPTSCANAWPTANGWSTCATGSRSPPGTWPARNFGLDGSFATYLGWLIPWGTPVTLLGETVEQVAEAQRELARIGIERPAAQATGTPADWIGDGQPAVLPRATFADLAQVRHHRRVSVLDVRRRLEWSEAHLDDSVHIALQDLLASLGDVPDGEVWVHCAAGYRATIAASLLAARGRRVVIVDDDFANVGCQEKSA